MYFYIVYNSITYANRVRDMLEGYAGYAAVVHTPREISIGGCSYSIKATEEKFRRAIEISQKNNISVKGIYKQNSDGGFTEVFI